MSQNGKGDDQRPRQISKRQWDTNYDNINWKDTDDTTPPERTQRQNVDEPSDPVGS